MTELSTIEFGAFNQIQAVSLELQEHLEIDKLENYLPPFYVQSKQCRHILAEKHFTVFELIMDDLYKKWLPNMVSHEKTQERDMLSFLYVIGCVFLWDMGIQRVAYAKEKRKRGEKIKIGNIYNYCPCQKKNPTNMQGKFTGPM